MSHRSTVELLEYTRLTLQLVERHQHGEEDAHLANELKLVLERYIAELEWETSGPVRSLRNFRSSERTGTA
ncbi:MAG: hypothetical protein WB561_11795 [Terracidiphilus sp.]